MSKKRVRTGSGSDRGIIASRQSSVVSAEFTGQPVSEPGDLAPLLPEEGWLPPRQTGWWEATGASKSSPPYEGGVDAASADEVVLFKHHPLHYARTHLWLVALVAFLSIGAIGAVLKYLDEDAQKQKLLAVKDRSALSALNPFLSA